MLFKIKSQDTLEHLSLHDCFISHTEWINNSLVFYLNWIDVLKTHPNNSFGVAKIAKNAILIFENAVELSCFYYDLTEAKKQGKKTNKQVYIIPDDAEIVDTTIIERCRNAEISDDSETAENGEKIWNCECNNLEFKISYSTMWVCFNDLDEDSWFEYPPFV